MPVHREDSRELPVQIIILVNSETFITADSSYLTGFQRSSRQMGKLILECLIFLVRLKLIRRLLAGYLLTGFYGIFFCEECIRPGIQIEGSLGRTTVLGRIEAAGIEYVIPRICSRIIEADIGTDRDTAYRNIDTDHTPRTGMFVLILRSR